MKKLLLIITVTISLTANGQAKKYFQRTRGSYSTGYLLDSVTSADYAFSVRKVSSTYVGNCLKVRRSSDNTEQDIGFVGDDVDLASIVTFVGAGSGFISKWYDQSGNARDAVQATLALQPRIILTGKIDQEIGGRLAIHFIASGTNNFLAVGSSTGLDYNGTGMSVSIIQQVITNSGTSNVAMSKGNSDFTNLHGYYLDIAGFVMMSSTQTFVLNTFRKSAEMFTYFMSGATPNIAGKCYQGDINTASASSMKYTAAGTFGINIGCYDSGGAAANMQGYMSELIAWSATKETKHNYLFRNQNLYFKIH